MSDIHIRPAVIDDAPVLARILTETGRETFRGLVPDQCLHSPTLEESERNWCRFFRAGSLDGDEIMLVATDDKGVMSGYILAGRKTKREDYPRELSVLMIAPAWQRQGIGRKLITRVAQELSRQGETSLLVGILKENPNWVFYERLGARQVGGRPIDWAGYETQIILYGWDDLAELVRQGQRNSSII